MANSYIYIIGKEEPIKVSAESGARAQKAWESGLRTISYDGGILATSTISRIDHDEPIREVKRIEDDKYKRVEMTPEQIERRDSIIAYTKKYARLKQWHKLRDAVNREKFVKAYIEKKRQLGKENLSTGSPEENRNLYESLKKDLFS